MAMATRYRMRLGEPGERLRMAISVTDHDGVVFSAGMALRRWGGASASIRCSATGSRRPSTRRRSSSGARVPPCTATPSRVPRELTVTRRAGAVMKATAR
jgi:hypothetical protein